MLIQPQMHAEPSHYRKVDCPWHSPSIIFKTTKGMQSLVIMMNDPQFIVRNNPPDSFAGMSLKFQSLNVSPFLVPHGGSLGLRPQCRIQNKKNHKLHTITSFIMFSCFTLISCFSSSSMQFIAPSWFIEFDPSSQVFHFQVIKAGMTPRKYQKKLNWLS